MEETETKSWKGDGDYKSVDYSNMNRMHAKCDNGRESQKVDIPENPFKNGYSSSLSLLMSMASDVNKNLSDHATMRTHRTAGQDDNSRTVSPNHASELLRAAASVVNQSSNNGLVSLPPADSLMPNYVSSANIMLNNKNREISLPRSDDSTVVSFSAKSTMSTGITTSPVMNSNFADRTMVSVGFPANAIPASAPPVNSRTSVELPFLQQRASERISTESAPGKPATVSATQSQQTIVVPFLWQRHKKEDKIHYERFVQLFLLSVIKRLDVLHEGACMLSKLNFKETKKFQMKNTSD